MIELIALFAAGTTIVLALLALAFFVGAALARRVRPEVGDDDPEEDVDPDDGGKDSTIAV